MCTWHIESRTHGTRHSFIAQIITGTVWFWVQQPQLWLLITGVFTLTLWFTICGSSGVVIESAAPESQKEHSSSDSLQRLWVVSWGKANKY